MVGKFESGTTLITPTGDRSFCLKRCIYYVNRQTVLPNQWIIADNGSKQTAINLVKKIDKKIQVSVINNQHLADKKTGYSFTGNLLSTIKYIRHEHIIIFEDDDWYHQKYIERTLQRLEQNDIVGQPRAIYYNVYYLKWRINGNKDRASLCETAFRSRLICKFKKMCEIRRSSAFVDSRFWKYCLDNQDTIRWKLFSDKRYVIGMKGLPGRKGVGIGHRPGGGFLRDAYYEKLKELIGNEDAKFYIDWRTDLAQKERS